MPEVLVSHDIKHLFEVSSDGWLLYVQQQHLLVAILADAPNRSPDFELLVPVGRNASIRTIQARIIMPNGRVQTVDPRSVDDANAPTKLFRIPRPDVGSLIEYVYIIDGHLGISGATGLASTPQPTEHYHVDITLRNDVRGVGKTYNSKEGFKKTVLGDFTTFTLDLHDVPSNRMEFLAPPPLSVLPHWAFRVESFDFQNRAVPVHDSWETTMLPLVALLYRASSPYFKDLPDFDLNDASCNGQRRCLVEYAMQFVREHTDLTSMASDFREARTVKKIIRSGKATSFEKALVLWSVLKSQKVEARFALLHRNPSEDQDHDFPVHNDFDHVVLYIPALGESDAVFVDPSCEACSFGQIPSWSAHREALVFDAGAQGTGKTVVTFIPVAGEVADSGMRLTTDVVLDDSGAANISTSQEYFGSRAAQASMDARLNDREDLAAMQKQDWERRYPGMTPTRNTPMLCNERRTSCIIKFGLHVKDVAKVSGDGLSLPLAFLHSNWDPKLPDKERRMNFYIPQDSSHLETVTIHLPKGYAASTLPTAWSAKTPIVDFDFSVKSVGDDLIVKRDAHSHYGRFDRRLFSNLNQTMRSFAGLKKVQIDLTKSP